MQITKKAVNPSFSPESAFLAQRKNEAGSERLRAEVQAMLRPGRAHTATVAKVFALLVNADKDRFGIGDVQRVLRDFDVTNGGPSYW